MKASQEQIEAIKRARRLFCEDRTQQDLSLGTCTALAVIALMEVTEAIHRVADAIEQNGGEG